MSAVDIHAPTGVWQWFIINVFGFIANYGWRIVVLVIFLKLILSPLDFYQRYKMRKNQRITEALQPQMDKLEKQYGADKQMLQRKQMELQKGSGFSYMSACLPMIITLVLFITFFTALRNVSSYMEFKQYVEMYDAYVTSYNETGFDYEARASAEGKVELNDKIVIKVKLPESADGEESEADGETSEPQITEEYKDINFAEIDAWLKDALKDRESIVALLSSPEIEALLTDAREPSIETPEKAADILLRFNTEYHSSYREYVEANKGKDSSLNLAMSVVMQVRAQEAAYDMYKVNHTSFIWIKSLWVPDVPWQNAVQSWSNFESTMGSWLDFNKNPRKVYTDNKTLFNDMAGKTNGYSSVKAYDIVTAKVRGDSSLNKTNGYMIMVVLVVGLSLLSQFISTRQQKKAGQMNTQGAGMMKVMMWIMPIMLGVFAITSSSAFTLYMVTNSIMTLIINFVTTLIVNLIDGGVHKKESQIIKYGRQDPNDKIKNKK